MLYVFTEDQVYLADDSHRFEYVLNESGRIWQSKHYRAAGISWNFGQVTG